MSVRQQLRTVLPSLFGPEADDLARATGFTRHQSKISGSAFARSLVLTWLGDGDARLSAFVAELAAQEVYVTNQAVQKRFGESAAAFLRALLECAVQQAVVGPAAPLPILDRFTSVVSHDATIVSLPAELAKAWLGCGGRLPGNGAAAVKIAVGWDLLHGHLTQLSLHDGRTHDRACLPPPEQLPPGALRLTDLGYFALPALAELSARHVSWLSRLQAGTCLRYGGQWWTQAALLRAHGPQQPGQHAALTVEVGRRCRLQARLRIEPVPPEVADQRRAEVLETARVKQQQVSEERLELCGWTLLITNVEPDRLSVAEALALYRVRWQIELLFKLWKSDGGLAVSRSAKPWRLLCEFYAKLLALLLTHWLMLLRPWRKADSSWRRMAARVRDCAPLLSLALARPRLFGAVFDYLDRLLGADTRIAPRRHRPATFQRLDAAMAGSGPK